MRKLLATLAIGAAAVAVSAQAPPPATSVKRPAPAPAAKDEPKKDEPKEKPSLELPVLKGVKAKDGKPSEPTVIKSEDDLMKAFGEDGVKEYKIDFKKEYLALFSWSGSGQDKLTHATETKDGKTTVTTTYAPGRTRDLVPHFALIKLPVGAEWKMAK